jgi:RND family efflux transporter MFP subunit
MCKGGSVRVTLTVVAVLTLFGCARDNHYAAPPPPKVMVATPVEQQVSRYFESTGNTAAINAVDLVARIQGFVQEINYRDGEFVKKGTSLFVIEPEPYQLKVDVAKASVKSAEATLTQNETEYQRQTDLLKRQVSAQVAYDQALAQRDTAQANVQSAKANERQAEINLSYTNVTAPFDGVVSVRQVSIGQFVGATSATVLSTIVELSPIWVNFTASERDVLQVRANLHRADRTTEDLLGIPVEIGLQTESGYPHKGKLDYVASTVDPATGTLAARAVLENSDRTLLPGYFVRVRIPSPPEPALLVSDAAIGSDQGGRYVLVVNKDNLVEQRTVEPGQLVGELRVIEKGLSKDDRVVVGGITRAIPGQKVQFELHPVAAAGQ